MKLSLRGIGFVNKVTKLEKVFAYDISFSKSKKIEDGTYSNEYFNLTAYSKKEFPINVEGKVPLIIEVSELSYKTFEKDGKTYVNHTAFLDSLATPVKSLGGVGSVDSDSDFND